MKNTITKTKKFVSKHRVGLAVVATITVAGAIQYRTAREFNNFLKEKGLYDEYYDMSWDIDPNN